MTTPLNCFCGRERRGGAEGGASRAEGGVAQRSRAEWEKHRAELRVENPAIIGHSGKRRRVIGDGACVGCDCSVLLALEMLISMCCKLRIFGPLL